MDEDLLNALMQYRKVGISDEAADAVGVVRGSIGIVQGVVEGQICLVVVGRETPAYVTLPLAAFTLGTIAGVA
jgi:hypothetical protein